MQYVGSKCSEFITGIQQSTHEGQYLYHDPVNRKFKLLPLKDRVSSLEKNFHRLKFSTIIKIVYGFKSKILSDPTKALIVFLALKSMHSRKIQNQEKRFFAFNTISYYWECAQNKIDGFGFTSTNRLYFDLIKELEKNSVKQNVIHNSQSSAQASLPSSSLEQPPSFSPGDVVVSFQLPTANSNPVVKQPQLSTTTSIKRAHLKRTTSEKTQVATIQKIKSSALPTITESASDPQLTNLTNKKAPLTRAKSERINRYLIAASSTGNIQNLGAYVAPTPIETPRLEIYAANCQECDSKVKQWIFANISAKHPKLHQPNPNSKKPRYFVDLLAVLCKSEKIDLKDPKCRQAILDMFCFKEEREQEELVAWLKEEKTFPTSLIEEIFCTLYAKFLTKQYVSFSVIYTLFSFYQKKILELSFLGTSLPSNNKGIITGMTLMLQLQPNDSKTIDCAEWFCLQDPFILENFITWMNIFVSKGFPASYLYPARDHFIERFLKEPPLWAALLDQSSNELITYVENVFIDIFWCKDKHSQTTLFQWMQQVALSPLFIKKCIDTLVERMIKKSGVDFNIFRQMIDFYILQKTEGSSLSRMRELEPILDHLFLKQNEQDLEILLDFLQQSHYLPLTFWKNTLSHLVKNSTLEKSYKTIIKKTLNFCYERFYLFKEKLEKEDLEAISSCATFLKDKINIQTELEWISTIIPNS